jgi:hypothetical protein
MKFSFVFDRALLVAAVIAAVIIVSAPDAAAQCEVPACNMSGERYDPADGNCHSGPDPLTGALSHRIPACRADERFIRETGMCRLNACTSGSCEARPLCGGSWPNYARNGTDSTGAYGVCESNPNWLGHRSHTIVRCEAGFTLNTGRGMCIRCPTIVPVPIRRPDLIIRSTSLRQGGVVVTRVRRGQPYYACFVVANIGDAASGAFHVGGGGLGVPTPPSQAHATLAAGATRSGCLLYSRTPAVGSYRLGIDADSRTAVLERREDNNGAVIAVQVVP